MNALIVRIWKEERFTIGRMYVDGLFLCHILEDRDRGLRQGMPEKDLRLLKVAHETAIPAGHYKVRMTHSPRFGKMLPQIMDVPVFEGVRMHSGNSSKDTDGCLLYGDADERSIRDWVSNSKRREGEFLEKLKEAGGECDLVII